MKRLFAALLSVMILCCGCNIQGMGEILTEQDDLIYEDWSQLTGYWVTDGDRYFMLNVAGDQYPVFATGVWGPGSPGAGEVEDLRWSDVGLTAMVRYPGTDAVPMDSKLEDVTVALSIDWTDLEQGTMIITVDGESYLVTFAGDDAGEAYAHYARSCLLQELEGKEEPEQLTILWRHLEGCWESGDYFVEFSFQVGEPVFRWGQWNGSSREPSAVTALTNHRRGLFSVDLEGPSGEEAEHMTVLPNMTMESHDRLVPGSAIVLELPDGYFAAFTRCGESYEAVCAVRDIEP